MSSAKTKVLPEEEWCSQHRPSHKVKVLMLADHKNTVVFVTHTKEIMTLNVTSFKELYFKGEE